jgi:hypothetical protein
MLGDIMKPKFNIFFYTLILSVLMVNCTNSVSTNSDVEELEVDDLELKSKMKQATLLITELAKNEQVVKEIQYAVAHSIQEGRDEDVTFSELFFEDAQYKVALKSIDESIMGSFKNEFRQLVTAKLKTQSENIDEDLENYLIQNNLKLYWPYSENWENVEGVLPTLSYHPLINEDENEGFLPSDSKTKTTQPYETVLMNDEYAFNNPSLLIVPCEIPQLKVVVNSAQLCGGPGGGGTDPGEDNNGEEIAYKTNIGYAKLTEQKDGLFAGGSEIYWISSSALFTSLSDTVPTLTPIKKKYSFRRPDIRHKRWKKLEMQLDQDWSEYEIAREMWIIEGDGDPELKKLGITLKKDELGEVGFSFEKEFQVDNRADSKRETLFLEWLQRDIYFAHNKQNGGHGWKDDFQVYHADHLFWTTPIREVNY